MAFFIFYCCKISVSVCLRNWKNYFFFILNVSFQRNLFVYFKSVSYWWVQMCVTLISSQKTVRQQLPTLQRVNLHNSCNDTFRQSGSGFYPEQLSRVQQESISRAIRVKLNVLNMSKISRSVKFVGDYFQLWMNTSVALLPDDGGWIHIWNKPAPHRTTWPVVGPSEVASHQYFRSQKQ